MSVKNNKTVKHFHFHLEIGKDDSIIKVLDNLDNYCMSFQQRIKGRKELFILMFNYFVENNLLIKKEEKEQ